LRTKLFDMTADSGRTLDKTAQDEIILMLQSDDLDSIKLGLKLAGSAHQDLFTPAIIKVLESSSDAHICGEAMQALSEIASETAHNALFSHLFTIDDPTIQSLAIESLSKSELRRPKMQQFLTEHLNSEEWELKRACALALATTDSPKLELAGLVASKEISDQMLPAYCLGRLPVTPKRESLISQLLTKNANIVNETLASIRHQHSEGIYKQIVTLAFKSKFKREATHALIRCGDAASATLRDALLNRRYGFAEKEVLVRVLARCGGKIACDSLIEMLDEYLEKYEELSPIASVYVLIESKESGQVPMQAASQNNEFYPLAAASLHKRMSYRQLYNSALKALIRIKYYRLNRHEKKLIVDLMQHELTTAEYFNRLHHSNHVTPDDEVLIRKIVEDQKNAALQNYFDLLQLLKGPNVAQARLSLHSTSADNAEESILALTPISVRSRFQLLWNETPPESSMPNNWSEWLEHCWECADPWIILIALDAAYHSGLPQPQPLVDFMTSFGDALSIHVSQLLSPKTEGKTMLTTLEQIKFLSTAPLFETLPLDDIQRISEVCQQMTVMSNEILFQQNDPGDALYLVAEGKIGIMAGDKLLAELTSGECFGEMALVDNEPRSAGAKVLEDSLLLRIDKNDFDDIVAERTTVARGIFKVLSKRLREAIQSNK
jgi:CRP/FNR family cyclic AMP-dependent transcriptional regulator